MVTLQLDNLGARYGNRMVISGIHTPVFCSGQMIAVMGPNASGKSTLFKRIAGLLNGPGSVRLEGSRRGLSGICYLPQEISANARLTVYESIILARKQQSRSWWVDEKTLSSVEDIMTSLGIAELAFRPLNALSGGQRQLVSIAQTLALDPEILLMDEPTSALDLHYQLQVLGLMRTLSRQRGLMIFMALHDLNQALRFSDQALVIANGSLQSSGAAKDVITVDMLREVYRINARVEHCSMEFAYVVVDGVV